MAKAVEEKTGAEVNAAKLKALQATIDKIEKDYGKGTIMKLGDQPEWDAAQVDFDIIDIDIIDEDLTFLYLIVSHD